MTARAIWSGAISFGLVNINVKLYSATEEHDISFHQTHVHEDGREHGRIKYKRTCSVCEVEVEFADIAKGYDTEQGTVILTKEDFAALPLDTLSTIELQEFVPINCVDPMLFERHYTLTPDIPVKAKGKPAGTKAAKAYGLLTQALADSGKVGIVKVTLRQREQVGMLSVRNGRMALTTLRWADEIREMPEANYPVADEAELELASLLIESLSVDGFDHSVYEDGYQVALEAVIATKQAGLTVEPVKVQASTSADDLMATLRASVAAHTAKRRNGLKVVA